MKDIIPSKEQVMLNIRYHRVTQGYTQEDFAELINMNYKHFSKLENLDYALSLDNLDLIARALKKEPWELLKEKHTREEVPSRLDYYQRQQQKEEKK